MVLVTPLTFVWSRVSRLFAGASSAPEGGATFASRLRSVLDYGLVKPAFIVRDLIWWTAATLLSILAVRWTSDLLAFMLSKIFFGIHICFEAFS